MSSNSSSAVIRDVFFALQAVGSVDGLECTEAFIDNIEVTQASDHLTNIIYVVYAVGVILSIFNALHVLHLLELDDACGCDMEWIANPTCDCGWIEDLLDTVCESRICSSSWDWVSKSCGSLWGRLGGSCKRSSENSARESKTKTVQNPMYGEEDGGATDGGYIETQPEEETFEGFN